jgi:hypothetical protein
VPTRQRRLCFGVVSVFVRVSDEKHLFVVPGDGGVIKRHDGLERDRIFGRFRQTQHLTPHRPPLVITDQMSTSPPPPPVSVSYCTEKKAPSTSSLRCSTVSTMAGADMHNNRLRIVSDDAPAGMPLALALALALLLLLAGADVGGGLLGVVFEAGEVSGSRVGPTPSTSRSARNRSSIRSRSRSSSLLATTGLLTAAAVGSAAEAAEEEAVEGDEEDEAT